MTIFGLDAYGVEISLITTIIVSGLFILFEKKPKRTYQPKHQKSNDNFVGEDVPSLELNREEFYKTLNFMMMYGIITFEEYNELTMKSLAYVKC